MEKIIKLTLLATSLSIMLLYPIGNLIIILTLNPLTLSFQLSAIIRHWCRLCPWISNFNNFLENIVSTSTLSFGDGFHLFDFRLV